MISLNSAHWWGLTGAVGIEEEKNMTHLRDNVMTVGADKVLLNLFENVCARNSHQWCHTFCATADGSIDQRNS